MPPCLKLMVFQCSVESISNPKLLMENMESVSSNHVALHRQVITHKIKLLMESMQLVSKIYTALHMFCTN